MLNFNLHTTTEIVFGKDIEEQIGPRLKELGAHRILVHFGGSSARTSGLLDRVEKSLFAAGLAFVELGESSNSCVLTNEETKEKRGITSETNRPRISFLDPENTYTVSKFQTGCGIVDIMMHTLERYLTPEGGESDITDRIAEGLLITVRDAGRRAIANPRDYEARASLMWAGSVSHNDYTGCGRKRLFPVHKLEHELSAFRDEIAHGAGLSVLFPAWALYEMKNDFPRFAQLANRVFGVEMDFHHPERTAREGILTMKRFFEEIGMPTHLAQLGIKPENYAQLAANTVRTVKGPVKSYSALDEQAIIEIYKLAE